MPRRPTRFDLLILDCDGVVVDSEPITMRVLAEMLNELGASTNTEAITQKLIGTTFDRTLEVITETLGKPLPADFVPHYRDRTFAALESGLKPVPGIEDSVSGIAAARAAGMEVFGFAGSAPEEALFAAGARRVFRQMADLPMLVAGAD